jgi:hypothetical protein
MEIAIAHHSLNIPGGAERLCLAVIEALRKRGHNVALITVEKTDWRIVQKNFGNVTMPNRESYLTSNRVSANLSSIHALVLCMGHILHDERKMVALLYIHHSRSYVRRTCRVNHVFHWSLYHLEI